MTTTKCPICGKMTVQRYRPFCSKRCADLDLGKWFGGDYRVETNEEASIEDLLVSESRNNDE